MDGFLEHNIEKKIAHCKTVNVMSKVQKQAKQNNYLGR